MSWYLGLHVHSLPLVFPSKLHTRIRMTHTEYKYIMNCLLFKFFCHCALQGAHLGAYVLLGKKVNLLYFGVCWQCTPLSHNTTHTGNWGATNSCKICILNWSRKIFENKNSFRCFVFVWLAMDFHTYCVISFEYKMIKDTLILWLKCSTGRLVYLRPSWPPHNAISQPMNQSDQLKPCTHINMQITVPINLRPRSPQRKHPPKKIKK